MKFAVSKKDFSRYCLFFFWVVYYHFFYIFTLNIQSSVMNRFGWILTMAIYIFMLKGRRIIRTQYGFVFFFIWYCFAIQSVECVYSMFKYNQSLVDMYKCAGAYLYLLISIILLLSIYESGVEKIANQIVILGFALIVLELVNAILINNFGIRILDISELKTKVNRFRSDLGALCPFIILYSLYRFLNTKKIRWISVLFVCIFSLFYVEQTRARELAVVISCYVLLSHFFIINGKKGRTLGMSIMVLASCCILRVFEKIKIIFSVDPSVNENFNSTLARRNAISYFWNMTKDNVLLGMGWINPKNDYLKLIWSGPYNTYFYDDLGMLGLFFRNGIMGISLYFILLARMFFVFLKLRKTEVSSLLMGILMYIGSTIPSLSIFDGQRIIFVPVALAIFEYYYLLYKEKLVGVKDGTR